MNHDLLEMVPDYVRKFQAYVPSPPDDVLCRRYGVERLFRLNNNENPLGPPPEALRILNGYPLENIGIYPSGDCYHLRRALAEKFGLEPDQFLVGNGANEVIAFVIKAFCDKGDNIVTADKTFTVYEWVAEFSGFEAKLVRLRGFALDPEAMALAVDERTKVVFLCNPNNPTGSYWTKSQFRMFMDIVGPKVIVVLDEAYIEYVEAQDFPDGISLLEDYPNLVVFRTFSKMYGLAGLRVGYLVASSALVELIRRTCVVYSVNALAQVAAQVAFHDEQHVQRTRALTRESREFLEAELQRLGLPYQSGVASFVMIELPISDTLVYKRLMGCGYMVRPMTSFRYPNYIRVSLHRLPVMQGFVEALESSVWSKVEAV